MANINGFNDNIGSANNPARGYNNNLFDGQAFYQGFHQPVTNDHLKIADEHRVLFVSGRKTVRNPHDQHYWDMLTFALCPTFKFLSVTFLIFLADIVMFIIEASVGLSKSSPQLLGINASTLIKYGANDSRLLLSGQVWRLLSAMFLHNYFMHLFGNIITTFMFLSRVEWTYGPVKTLIIYLLSGIGGNIFSALIDPIPIKAGASTALFGIIGVIIGYIIINWNGLDMIGQAMKCQIWCTGLMIVVFIFIFTPSSTSSSRIDQYGHLGGFLTGLWLSCIHQTIVNTTREKVLRGVFLGLLIIQYLVCFLVFYLKN